MWFLKPCVDHLGVTRAFKRTVDVVAFYLYVAAGNSSIDVFIDVCCTNGNLIVNDPVLFTLN